MATQSCAAGAQPSPTETGHTVIFEDVVSDRMEERNATVPKPSSIVTADKKSCVAGAQPSPTNTEHTDIFEDFGSDLMNILIASLVCILCVVGILLSWAHYGTNKVLDGAYKF